MKYADYMAMSPEDRMVFYRNLDSKTDREKVLFFRAKAELMLGRASIRKRKTMTRRTPVNDNDEPESA